MRSRLEQELLNCPRTPDPRKRSRTMIRHQSSTKRLRLHYPSDDNPLLLRLQMTRMTETITSRFRCMTWSLRRYQTHLHDRQGGDRRFCLSHSMSIALLSGTDCSYGGYLLHRSLVVRFLATFRLIGKVNHAHERYPRRTLAEGRTVSAICRKMIGLPASRRG
jgi:hypothetical protein